MTSLMKSAIVAVVCGILVFFGITFLFLLLSLLITYYNVTMERLQNATCTSGSCYYPPSSTIIGICVVVAIVVALSVFVSVKRHEGKRGPLAHHIMEELRHEVDDAKDHIDSHKKDK